VSASPVSVRASSNHRSRRPRSLEARYVVNLDVEAFRANGYAVVRGAVPSALCEALVAAIGMVRGLDADRPQTWYRDPPLAWHVVPMWGHQAPDSLGRLNQLRTQDDQAAPSQSTTACRPIERRKTNISVGDIKNRASQNFCCSGMRLLGEFSVLRRDASTR
jgi:hypothetical protein